MPGNPLTDPHLAPDLADTVERLVATIRDRATRPAVKVTRGLVFGLLTAILALVAVVLLLVALMRGIQTLLDTFLAWPVAVYVSYFIVGGILTLAGLLVLRKRPPPDA